MPNGGWIHLFIWPFHEVFGSHVSICLNIFNTKFGHFNAYFCGANVGTWGRSCWKPSPVEHKVAQALPGRTTHRRLGVPRAAPRCAESDGDVSLTNQWEFQDPKLEVPTIYKAYIRPM